MNTGPSPGRGTTRVETIMKTSTTLVKITVVFTIILVTMVACTPLYKAQAAEPTPTATPEATPTPAQAKVDVNSATLGKLTELPGIGKKIGQAIIDGRPYAKIEDLLKVKGIGEKKLAKIKNLIECKPLKEGKEAEGEKTEKEPEATPTPKAEKEAEEKPKK